MIRLTSRHAAATLVIAFLALIGAVFLCLPAQAGSPPLSGHLSHATSDMHHTPGAGYSPDRHAHHGALSDCTGSTSTGCLMALCHPAMLVDVPRMPDVANTPAAGPSLSVRALGNTPSIILPPPRHMRL